MRLLTIYVKEVAQQFSPLAPRVEGHSSNRTQLLVDNTKCTHLVSWKQDAYRRIGGGNSVSRLLPLANDTLHG